MEENDINIVISDFIAQTLKKYPECKSVDMHQLNTMLQNTFSQLREPSTFDKIYSWGQFLYSTYGWTSCIYGIYLEPQMAKFIFTNAVSAVKYALVLIF